MIIPDPNTTPFNTWIGQFINLYPAENIVRVSTEKDWRKFAASLKKLETFRFVPTPDTLIYPSESSWRKWASEAIRVLL